MAVHSRKTLTIQMPFKEVMSALERALGHIGAKISVSETDKANGKVSAKIGAGLLSWGENLTIIVQRFQGGCLVDVESKCVSPLQIFDSGKNWRNIENLARELALLEEIHIKTRSGKVQQLLKQQLVQWEKEGYDVSDLKAKYRKELYGRKSLRKRLIQITMLKIFIIIILIAICIFGLSYVL